MRGSLLSESHRLPADPVDFLAVAESRGWGDGLPLIPPTEERVQEMLDHVAEPPHAVVGVIEPGRGEATIEKIAINAVMAGCVAAALPAVVAAVRAVCRPEFNLYALNTTTCSATPALVFNGPVRAALGIESGYSCLGTNGRANATIGRALRLVLRNLGGAVPGTVSKSVFGQPGRISLCFGEREERSPWPPLHVRRGFQAADSVVTAHCATGTQDIADIWADSGEELLFVIAHSLDWIGNNKVLVPQAEGEMLVLLCPDFAERIAGDGLSLAEAQRLLHENTQTPIERWHRNHWAKLEARGFVVAGRVPLCAAPEQFLLVVAGGDSGHHALNLCTFGHTRAVSIAFDPTPAGLAGEACELPTPPSDNGPRR